MSLILTPGQLQRRAALFQQLAQLLSAGISLPAALATQSRAAAHASFRAPLATLERRLQEGATFGEALDQVHDWLPPFDAALLQAGEESGRLPESLQLLAADYQHRAGMSRVLLGLLAYPVLVLHLALLIFPVERLQQLILQGDWPGYLGQKLVAFGPLYALVFAGMLAFQGSRGEHWRALVERVLAVVPGLGSARRHLALARLAAALEALLSAGIPILRAWPLAAKASGSPALRRAVDAAQPHLELGVTPAEMVSRSREFPAGFASQYATGEASGRLDESLRRLREEHHEEGVRRLKLALVAMAGLLIGGVMLYAAWQIVAFYLGYFRQLQEVM